MYRGPDFFIIFQIILRVLLTQVVPAGIKNNPLNKMDFFLLFRILHIQSAEGGLIDGVGC